MKSTKIVCTIGPKSQSYQIISDMALAGMNVVRINLSHGNYDFHKKTIQLTRRVSEEFSKHIGIILDLQGPKIRTGKLKKEMVVLNRGDRFILTTDNIEGDWKIQSINYSEFPNEVKKGDRIFLDDGNIELKVLEVDGSNIICEVLNGGSISSYRGVNLPDTYIKLPSLTQKDRDDLIFGLEHEVDFIALSFVRKAGDIEELKDFLQKNGRSIPVISKIEKPEAVKNINQIVEISDGIMVARGDLGAETSPQEVPIIQKMLIDLCNRSGKPVITATQMLESMIHHPRPTRAEASDVANAIFDGTDAVMLSGETAVGEYPVQSVKVMSDIALRTEKEIFSKISPIKRKEITPSQCSIPEAVCFSASKLPSLLKLSYIIAFTLSGTTARLMSKYRPPVPVIALSPKLEMLRRLSLSWGVYPEYIREVDLAEELIGEAEKILVQRGLCKEGDIVLLVGGVPVMAGQSANMIKVHTIELEGKNI